MLRYVVASVLCGVLFGIMDGLINGNPLAKRLYEIYESISKQSPNIPAGLAIDLAYGFIMAGVFLLLQKSLPGKSWLLKGASFSLLIWFFRVVMYVATQWMMFAVPISALLYTLGTGLIEMMILGLVCSAILRR
jgi:hypothetical protein